MGNVPETANARKGTTGLRPLLERSHTAVPAGVGAAFEDP
jgi:hypothetical protein